jgi:hypothetical protein
MRIGEHEFESEGPIECVERHLATFIRFAAPALALPDARSRPPVSLNDLASVSGRTVYLKVPTTITDAILIILLGQKELRQSEVVSGVEIMNGLRFSGASVTRADGIIRKQVDNGSIISIGRYRARRYHLSSKGVERARQVAQKLAAAAEAKAQATKSGPGDAANAPRNPE